MATRRWTGAASKMRFSSASVSILRVGLSRSSLKCLTSAAGFSAMYFLFIAKSSMHFKHSSSRLTVAPFTVWPILFFAGCAGVGASTCLCRGRSRWLFRAGVGGFGFDREFDEGVAVASQHHGQRGRALERARQARRCQSELRRRSLYRNDERPSGGSTQSEAPLDVHRHAAIQMSIKWRSQRGSRQAGMRATFKTCLTSLRLGSASTDLIRRPLIFCRLCAKSSRSFVFFGRRSVGAWIRGYPRNWSANQERHLNSVAVQELGAKRNTSSSVQRSRERLSSP